ncbi:MAG TPA: ABC-ATPase domain-containing protein [Chloroflexota bacterium]|nr:ABC-ATPase domain-containing protein [Chloroflexota bacterium]
MRNSLEQRLRSIDRRGYPAYKELAGAHEFPNYTLYIDHVQGDPFAAPSMLRVRVPQQVADFPATLYSSPVRRVALEDYLTRQFAAAIRRHVKGSRGTGKSGRISVDVGGQEILERTSCVVNGRFVEIRFSAGLPAAGRTVLAGEAIAMFYQEIPRLVEASLRYSALNPQSVQTHVEVAEDDRALREQLEGMGLVAFVADGAILPRESGVSARPMAADRAVPFASPPQLQVELQAPNRGKIPGMGIPAGITLIVGGGYHGKSTLLSALQMGVYDHIPGDGREYVVTRTDAVKIRAEDGRRVERVNVSPFISNLPFQKDTTAFSTDNASGSTSQAANIVEALEAGSRLLLMDEDSCATNFMIRDEKMQKLVPKEREPITPLIDQVRSLFDEHGVSTLLVMGGSGDYFEVADTVISLDSYRPKVVTDRARQIASEDPSPRRQEAAGGFGRIVERIPLAESLNPYRGERVKVRARGMENIQFGDENIDLDDVEQLVDPSQSVAIANMLLYALNRGYLDNRTTLRRLLERIYGDLASGGLDAISPFRGERHPGDYAMPRMQEVAAAINRLRTLAVRQVP